MSCPEGTTDIAGLLKRAGLRPTRQRMSLGALLFGSGDRHLTAEMLHMEAIEHQIPVSLATVYNTLHQFTLAGLLREVAIEGSKTYFDTNTSDHHHFYFERDGVLMDIEGETVSVLSLPEPPEGMEISRVDVLVRLVAKQSREEG
jgi:Fur family iron response transcriptional regulator